MLKVGFRPNLSPGVFSNTDVYCKRRWRQIQYLVQQFWVRWSREYLQTLQVRQKWLTKKSNLKVRYIVLICDRNLPRGKWALGRVIETFPDKHDNVRQALIKTSTTELKRPITKLCHIVSPPIEEDKSN